MISLFWIITISIALIFIITIVIAIALKDNCPDWLVLTSVTMLLPLICLTLFMFISVVLQTDQYFTEEEYNLEQMADTYDLKAKYKEDIDAPYIKGIRLYGMEEYHYYIPMSYKYEQFKITQESE